MPSRQSGRLEVLRKLFQASRCQRPGTPPVGGLAWLRVATRPSPVLADLGEGIQLRISQPDKFEHEGELTINLHHDGLCLHSLLFTLGRLQGQGVAHIGGLQGLHPPDALDIYRDLTYRLHGLRQRDLLLNAFRSLCKFLGVTTILAIADSHRVSTSAYLKSDAQVCTSNDSAWPQRPEELTLGSASHRQPTPACIRSVPRRPCPPCMSQFHHPRCRPGVRPATHHGARPARRPTSPVGGNRSYRSLENSNA